MSLVRFLIVLAVGTLLSWGAWVLVLLTLDPFTNGAIALSLFSLSFWLALVGTFTFGGFFVRYWFEKDAVPFRQLGIAFRQSLLVSSGIIVALLLQSVRLLHWWTIGLLVLLLVMIEFFYLADDARRPNTRIHEPDLHA